MSESLYFIAVVPPSKIQDEITQLKNEVADKFGSRHALNAPAHITLHMPFRWKEAKLEVLTEMLADLNSEIEPFVISLSGFDFFEPRVLFVDVVENPKLFDLQKRVQYSCRLRLGKVNANYRDQVFHPHVTIGFRDLKKAKFYEARDFFLNRKFESEFEVNEVSLLKHDGAKWNVIET